MEKFILDYIKSKYNIMVVLRRSIERGIVNSLLLDFMSTDGKYYSFLIFYNSTRIFTDLTSLLGNGNLELGHYLDENVRVFDEKESWANGRYASSIPTVFNEHLKVHLERFLENLYYGSCGGYRVTGTKIVFEPVVTLILYYTLNDVEQIPLAIGTDWCVEIDKETKWFLDCLELPDIFRYKVRCCDDDTGFIR